MCKSLVLLFAYLIVKSLYSSSDFIFSVLKIFITFGLLILPLHIVMFFSFTYKKRLYLTKFDIKQNNPTSMPIKENNVVNTLYACKEQAQRNTNEIGAKKLKSEYKTLVLVFSLIILFFSILSIHSINYT